MTELNDALRWNDIAVAPGALARAHASYTDAIDALLPGCVPIAATVVQGSNMTTGIRASDAELAKLRAHQRKLAAAADAAEAKLFDELAVAAAALPDEAKARLDALRARRSLARLIEGMQRRCAIRGQWDNPPDVGGRLNVSGDLKQLPPSVRIAISAAYDSMAAERRRAWTSAEAAVDASIAETATEQRDTQQPEHGYMQPSIVTIAAATAARLMRVELDTLRAVGKAAPPAAVRLSLAEEAMVSGRWHAPQPNAEMPRWVEGESPAMWQLMVSLLHQHQWNAATRASIRPVLVGWMQEDGVHVRRWLDAMVRASEQETPDTDPYSPLYDELLEARSALARDKLAELTTITKAEWLVGGGTIPSNPNELPAMTDINDLRDFGAPIRQARPADPAPSREQYTSAERHHASQGMLPMPWRDGERQDALDALHLDDAQLLIATQVFADAKDEWATTVEPLARELQAVQRRRNAAGHRDVDARIEAMSAIVGASAQRRECWAAARAIEERLFSNLEKALGPTHEVGRHYLMALRLVRAREAVFQGSSALLSAFYKSYVPDVVEAALGLRATPQERALVLAALSAQCADFVPVRSAEWESAMKIQEEGEAIELRQATRRRISNSEADTEARVAANQESAREITAMYANADALIARMKQFDRELLGRMHAALPDHLGARLRRAIHVIGGSPNLSRITNQRINVLFALRSVQPDAVPGAEATFNTTLEAWEAWAEPIVQEIDRLFAGTDAVKSIEQDSLSARRASMLQFLLAPSAADRMDQALCAIAANVPPETARRLSQLARFVPDER